MFFVVALLLKFIIQLRFPRNFSIFTDHYLRPVVIIGPLAEPVCDKLVMEWPYKFARSLPGQ